MGSRHDHSPLAHDPAGFCAVAPSPELRERLEKEVTRARGRKNAPTADLLDVSRHPRPLGFDDGVIVPPDEFPLGTSVAEIRAAALERAPLRGTVRVIVVLVDFSDRAMAATADHFQRPVLLHRGAPPRQRAGVLPRDLRTA